MECILQNGKIILKCFQKQNKLVLCSAEHLMEMEHSHILTLEQQSGACLQMETRIFQFILQHHWAGISGFTSIIGYKDHRGQTGHTHHTPFSGHSACIIADLASAGKGTAAFSPDKTGHVSRFCVKTAGYPAEFRLHWGGPPVFPEKTEKVFWKKWLFIA